MKVLFCLPGNEWGGPEREPVRTLASALSEHVEVSFIQFSRDAKEVLREGSRTSVLCRSSHSRSMLDGFRVERNRMAAEIRRQNPDLVHVHWTQLGHALAAMDSGIPYVVTVHDAAWTSAYWNWSWAPSSILAALGGLLITRAALRNASHIIAVSPYVAEHVQRFYPPGKKQALCSAATLDAGPSTLDFPLSIIPNPVSLPEILGFKPQVSRASPVFAAIGHWGRLKNFDLALKAFAMVRRQIPAANLVLIGKDLGRGTLCYEWACRRGLQEGVEFRGPVEHLQLMGFLRDNVDGLVHPARTEGFSLVVADAMAAGVPVIAAAAGALPWLLGEGAFGTLVYDRSPASWAEAMLEATAASSAAVDRARDRIASLCDPAVIAAKHMGVYARVLPQIQNSPCLGACGEDRPPVCGDGLGVP